MANIYYAPARATGSVKHRVNNTVNTIQSAMSGIRDVMLDAGWTLETMRPGHANIPFVFGVPWATYGPEGWVGSAILPGNIPDFSGHVIGLWRFIFAIDGTGYYFYNPAAGQEPIIGDVVNVPIGESNIATIASLAGSLEDWIALEFDNSHMLIQYDNMTYDDVGTSSHRIDGSGTTTGPTEEPWEGGYKMASIAPPGNSNFEVWLTEHALHGLAFRFPALAGPDEPDHEIRMGNSDAYNVWANSYGFGLWEEGGVIQGSTIGDLYERTRMIFATRPYLSSEVPVSDVLAVMWGPSRIGMQLAIFELFKGRVNGTITPGNEGRWAFYYPRTNKQRWDILTTAGKPLLVDAIIAMSSGTGDHPRLVGWLTDSFIETKGNAIDARAEFSGQLWDAHRCNLHDDFEMVGAVGTLWLRMDD